jgi:hypothetical protein
MALAVVVSLATTPGFAMSFSNGSMSVDSASYVHIAKKVSKKKPNKAHNYSAAKDYIPGRVRTPYGYKDCIGWWERHSNGRMECHGQMTGSY